MRLSTLCGLLCLLACIGSSAQQPTPDFAIIDVSQQQIRLFEAFKTKDSAQRSAVFADSLYYPYRDFWSGYLGDAKDFTDWVNASVLPSLDGYKKRNNTINGATLLRDSETVKRGMEKLTGFQPKGKWYIVYGPAWANLGGLSGGTMFIDLSHSSNTSNEAVMMMFPHEITHQIMSNVNRHYDTTALGSIINEGFAVYMNQVYWQDKYTLAEHLGYTAAELDACIQQKEKIQQFFARHYQSTGKEDILKFRNRDFHLQQDLPGAIGYYIGYRIVEQYVQRFGPQSWKDVFVKPPVEILRLSGYSG